MAAVRVTGCYRYNWSLGRNSSAHYSRKKEERESLSHETQRLIRPKEKKNTQHTKQPYTECQKSADAICHWLEHTEYACILRMWLCVYVCMCVYVFVCDDFKYIQPILCVYAYMRKGENEHSYRANTQYYTKPFSKRCVCACLIRPIQKQYFRPIYNHSLVRSPTTIHISIPIIKIYS